MERKLNCDVLPLPDIARMSGGGDGDGGVRTTIKPIKACNGLCWAAAATAPPPQPPLAGNMPHTFGHNHRSYAFTVRHCLQKHTHFIAWYWIASFIHDFFNLLRLSRKKMDRIESSPSTTSTNTFVTLAILTALSTRFSRLEISCFIPPPSALFRTPSGRGGRQKFPSLVSSLTIN